MNLHNISTANPDTQLVFDYMAREYPTYRWEIVRDGLIQYWTPGAVQPSPVEIGRGSTYWLRRARSWEQHGRPARRPLF